MDKVYIVFIQRFYYILTHSIVQKEIDAIFADKEIAKQYIKIVSQIYPTNRYILLEVPISGKELLEEVLKDAES